MSNNVLDSSFFTRISHVGLDYLSFQPLNVPHQILSGFCIRDMITALKKQQRVVSEIYGYTELVRYVCISCYSAIINKIQSQKNISKKHL